MIATHQDFLWTKFLQLQTAQMLNLSQLLRPYTRTWLAHITFYPVWRKGKIANCVKSQLEEGKGKIKLKHSETGTSTAKLLTEVTQGKGGKANFKGQLNTDRLCN